MFRLQFNTVVRNVVSGSRAG